MTVLLANKQHFWIQTHSGRQYYPTDPRPGDILMDDVAHALSMQCRYVGHCSRFYSVAEHSIYVSKLVPREHALAGLLHDAQEAYIHDISRPLKASLPDYKAIEELNWFVIAARFGLPLELPKCVKQADGDMLFVERRQLFPHPHPEGWGLGLIEPDPYPEVGLLGWPQHIAKSRFIERFYELTNGVAL